MTLEIFQFPPRTLQMEMEFVDNIFQWRFGRKYIYLYKINCVDFFHSDNKLNRFGMRFDAAFKHLFAFITFIIFFGSRYSAEKRNSIPPIEL